MKFKYQVYKLHNRNKKTPLIATTTSRSYFSLINDQPRQGLGGHVNYIDYTHPPPVITLHPTELIIRSKR